MKRKLIRQGAGGLTVCLPKEWTEANHLRPAEEVGLEIEENRIIITSKEGLAKKTIDLELSNLHVKAIQRVIRSAYREGYTELNLSFKNKVAEHFKHSYLSKEFPELKLKKEYPIADLIYDLTRDLIGFEIVEQKEHFVQVKQISKVDEEELNSSLRRMFRLTSELNTAFLLSLQKQPNQAENIPKIISGLRMFIDYGIRLLKIGVVKSGELKLYSIIQRMENMSHVYEFLATFTASLKKTREKQTLKMIGEIGQLIEFVHQAYYKFTRETYDEFDKKLREMYHQHNLTFKEASKEELRIRQMLTFCAMDLTIMMDNILSMNLKIYSAGERASSAAALKRAMVGEE